MLPPLNFPNYQFDVTLREGKHYIFDPVRKKQVRLTPEEWVRQHIIRYLAEALHYPVSHMVVEHALRLNNLTKRADLLVYNQALKPAFLIECKAPGIILNLKVMEQVSRYNLIFMVPWLMVSNGLIHYVAYVNHEERRVNQFDHIPDYCEI